MKTQNETSHISCLPVRREYSDQALAAGLVAKDPIIAAAFFEMYAEQINRLVWMLLRSEQDHDDLVSATFVAILKSIKNIKDAQKLSKWVVSITYNTVRTEIRKRQARRRFMMHVEQPDEHSTIDNSKPGDISGRILNILRKMKVESQVLFGLHYVEGYSYGEIAQLQGRSISTVKRKGRRAKAEFVKEASQDMFLSVYIEDINEHDCV